MSRCEKDSRYISPDTEYCLVCGLKHRKESKASLKRSEKRKEVNLIGFQDTRVRGGRKGGGRK